MVCGRKVQYSSSPERRVVFSSVRAVRTKVYKLIRHLPNLSLVHFVFIARLIFNFFNSSLSPFFSFLLHHLSVIFRSSSRIWLTIMWWFLKPNQLLASRLHSPRPTLLCFHSHRPLATSPFLGRKSRKNVIVKEEPKPMLGLTPWETLLLLVSNPLLLYLTLNGKVIGLYVHIYN